MGSTTKIDWADATWNPVTGCLHGCEYCYARGIANRFGRKDDQEKMNHDLQNPLRRVYRDDIGVQHLGRKLAYPYGFDPTFHRYKLEEPQHWKIPKNIFVCSMADLFGEWVPDEWIRAVFEACSAAQQHRYLFLTKAPDRYQRLAIGGMLSTSENIWYGTSTPKVTDNAFFSRPSFENGPYYHTFISIEPILERFGMGGNFGTVALTDWVIVGAETGNRKGRVIPQKEWIMELAEECAKRDKPIFMKESLRGIMGDDFRQEFPWEMP